MLHWALAQHPALWGGAESDFLSRVLDGAERAYRDGTRFGEHHFLVAEGISRAEFLRFIGMGIDAMYRSRSGGLRWIEQTPHYVLHYAGLEAMFPDARFIHITRDGRQAVNSMQKKFGWRLAKSMKTWRLLAGAGQRINERGPGNFLQVRYESIVRHPQQEMRRVFDFIEENYAPGSVEFLKTPINTAPGCEQEAPLDKLDPGRVSWGRSKDLLFRIYCRETQSRLGY